MSYILGNEHRTMTAASNTRKAQVLRSNKNRTPVQFEFSRALPFKIKGPQVKVSTRQVTTRAFLSTKLGSFNT